MPEFMIKLHASVQKLSGHKFTKKKKKEQSLNQKVQNMMLA